VLKNCRYQNYSLNVRVLTLLAMRVKESFPGLTASDVDILSKLILSDNESGECNELNLF
jgi:phage terminase Nu1 subunit (DNA packaging protein)